MQSGTKGVSEPRGGGALAGGEVEGELHPQASHAAPAAPRSSAVGQGSKTEAAQDFLGALPCSPTAPPRHSSLPSSGCGVQHVTNPASQPSRLAHSKPPFHIKLALLDFTSSTLCARPSGSTRAVASICYRKMNTHTLLP